MCMVKTKKLLILGSLGLFLFPCYFVFYKQRGILSVSKMLRQVDKSHFEDLNKMDMTNSLMSAEEDNDVRLHILRQQCKTHRSVLTEKSIRYNNIIVDEKHKILFCYIPKIACSQWKKIFLLLTNKTNVTTAWNLTNVHTFKNVFLSRYSTEERIRMLHDYKKYIFVRNPLERILSAYRSKFTNSSHPIPSFMKLYGRKIIKTYRSNPTKASMEKGNDVTFLEFVKYLTDQKTSVLEAHWNKYHKLCYPCQIHYDFIGKYETLERDSDFLLKSIGAPPNITFAPREVNYKATETRNVFGQFYSNLPMMYIAKLWELYKYDFHLFGYSFADSLKLIPTLSNGNE